MTENQNNPRTPYVILHRRTTSAIPGDDMPTGWYWKLAGETTAAARGPYPSHAQAELAALSYDPYDLED